MSQQYNQQEKPMVNAHLLEVISFSDNVHIENCVNDKAASVMTQTNCQYKTFVGTEQSQVKFKLQGSGFLKLLLKLEISSSK